MKLLLDENLPKRIKALLAPHEAFTVRDMGWNGRSNGELLRLMKEHGFDTLLTFDKNCATNGISSVTTSLCWSLMRKTTPT